jgi:tRNA pseudouridine55 synthase
MNIIDKNTVQQIQEKSSDNIILIDKPESWTSFDVVKKIKNLTGIDKVGHAGTLDPFASGLLIVGTGRYTKSLAEISNAAKEYVGTITLGKTTDSYDITGQVTSIYSGRDIENIDISNVLDSFVGEINQIPPMYSAKKVQGKRLYKMARRGKEITRSAQKVIVYEFRQLARKNSEFDFYVKCSKGTYIRTLAYDVGIKCGCGAYLSALRRIAVDQYHITNALTIQAFDQYWKDLN